MPILFLGERRRRRARAEKAATLLLAVPTLLGIGTGVVVSPARSAAIFSAAAVAIALSPKTARRQARRLHGLIVDWLVRGAVHRGQRAEARRTGRTLGLPTAGYQITREKAAQEFLKLRYASPEVLQRLARDADAAGNSEAADILRGWTQEAARRPDPRRLHESLWLPPVGHRR